MVNPHCLRAALPVALLMACAPPGDIDPADLTSPLAQAPLPPAQAAPQAPAPAAPAPIRVPPTPVAVPAAPAPAPAPTPTAAPSDDPHDFNSAQIAWRGYDAGMAEAVAQNKPICLVVYTTWCPHCRNFANVFRDPHVVAKARDFVMIKLDADQNSAIAGRFAPDGAYIPRAFFLGADGTLAADIRAGNGRYGYFWSERDPAHLLRGMTTASEQLRGS